MRETIDRLNDVIDHLDDLIKLKDIRINGLNSAIDYLKDRDKKVIRELKYLKSQYDSEAERNVMNSVIELVRKVYDV